MKIAILFSFFISLVSLSMVSAQVADDSLAYRYIVDYNVPESPAFSVLGINPNLVMMGSAAKPVAVHIGNQLLSGGSVDNGIAIDFNPYFTLLGGQFNNINDYRNNYWKRLLANTQLSIATTALEEFPNDLAYGFGGRLTLFDSKDQLFKSELGNKIDTCLLQNARGGGPVPPEKGETIEDISFNGCMTDAYEEVRNELLNQKGGAISLGWALSGRVQGAILRGDSISVNRNQLWLSGQYSLGKGIDLLGMVMQRFEIGNTSDNQTSLGIATRFSKSNFNFSGELIYQINGSQGVLDGGLNAAFRIMPKVLYVFHLATRDDPSDENIKKQLVARSGLRWNFSEISNSK